MDLSMEHEMVTLNIEIEQEFYVKLKAVTDSLGTTIEFVTVRFLQWCVEEPEAAAKYLLDAAERFKGEPEICRVTVI